MAVWVKEHGWGRGISVQHGDTSLVTLWQLLRDIHKSVLAALSAITRALEVRPWVTAWWYKEAPGTHVFGTCVKELAVEA
jgi:hypothetical protein